VAYDGKPYTIHAMEIDTFPVHIANHIAKHLAEKIHHERGIRDNPKSDLKAIRSEIEVSDGA